MNSPAVKIFKLSLGTHAHQHLAAPFIVEVLDIQLQQGKPVLWAKVWADSAIRKYVILCKQTGDDVVGDTSYLGTVQLPDDTVLHYFGGGPGL